MKWIREEDWEGLMAFLPCATPSAWVDAARVNEETLLLNHCYLEQCAARTAMTLMFRCPDRPELLAKMSKLNHYLNTSLQPPLPLLLGSLTVDLIYLIPI